MVEVTHMFLQCVHAKYCMLGWNLTHGFGHPSSYHFAKFIPVIFCVLQFLGYHGLKLGDSELEFFRQNNLSLAHNPNSNLK